MWIEIVVAIFATTTISGHPPCEDVDWNWMELTAAMMSQKSSSMWGCGLKWPGGYPLPGRRMSSSMWGCGLKLLCHNPQIPASVSSSMWGCGLKFHIVPHAILNCSVILHVRMWIEIRRHTKPRTRFLVILHVRMWIEMSILFGMRLVFRPSSSMWGCGLKCSIRTRKIQYPRVILHVRMWIEIPITESVGLYHHCHPPCEDVDWNCKKRRGCIGCPGHPPCEDVDWNFSPLFRYVVIVGHPPCEGVNWNCWTIYALAQRLRSPSVWGCGLKSCDVIRGIVSFLPV